MPTTHLPTHTSTGPFPPLSPPLAMIDPTPPGDAYPGHTLRLQLPTPTLGTFSLAEGGTNQIFLSPAEHSLVLCSQHNPPCSAATGFPLNHLPLCSFLSSHPGLFQVSRYFQHPTTTTTVTISGPLSCLLYSMSSIYKGI